MTNFISKDLIGTFFPDPQTRQLYASAQVIHTLISKQTIFHLLAYISNYLKTQGTLQSLKVGIIGLGHIGTTILEEIFHLQVLSPEQILISTRTPDKHRKFIEQGLRVIWDNEQVAKECDFIILACLPHQIDSVCSSIRSILSNKNKGIFTFTEEEKNPSTMIFSILAATPIAKVKQLTDNYPFILRSYIDVDLINRVIASVPEEISPASVCLENLPSHFVRTANDVHALFELFNAVFYGVQEIREEIVEFFCGAVDVEEGEYVRTFNNRFKEIMKEFGSI